MGRIRLITAAACATLLVGAAGVSAQPSDRTTFVTFSGPVSVPGTTLPAGTYTFRLADSPADRHVVQIFDREQSKLYATLLAVPAERNEPASQPVITFKETPSTMAPALRYWYYAGEKSGNEFVYPRAQALAIARATGEGVMSADTDANDINNWKGTPTRITADAEPSATATPAEPTPAQPSAASQPAEQPRTTPPPMSPAPEQPAATPAPQDRTVGTSGRTEPKELPRTAGELPAVGLIALFAFAGAVALRVARKAAV